MSTAGKTLGQSAKDAVRFALWRAGDRLRYRVLGRFKHRVWRRLVPAGPLPDPVRLHVGCGKVALDDWVNIDLQPLLSADLTLDVTRSLPFRDVDCIFAEHFLEHLHVDAALQFLRSAHDALREQGWIRLSTPNLDWVWANLYQEMGSSPGSVRRMTMALHANRAFYGWQHRFLWNRELLARALHAAGFADLRWCVYGESSRPEFENVERHETYEDTEEIPHVLIVEARKDEPRPSEVKELLDLMQREFLGSLENGAR